MGVKYNTLFCLIFWLLLQQNKGEEKTAFEKQKEKEEQQKKKITDFQQKEHTKLNKTAEDDKAKRTKQIEEEETTAKVGGSFKLEEENDLQKEEPAAAADIKQGSTTPLGATSKDKLYDLTESDYYWIEYLGQGVYLSATKTTKFHAHDFPWHGQRLKIFNSNEENDKKCITFQNKYEASLEFTSETMSSDEDREYKKSTSQSKSASISLGTGMGALGAAVSNAKMNENKQNLKVNARSNTVRTTGKATHRVFRLKDKCWRWLDIPLWWLKTYEELPTSARTEQEIQQYSSVFGVFGSHIFTEIEVGLAAEIEFSSTTSDEDGSLLAKQSMCSDLGASAAGTGFSASASTKGCNDKSTNKRSYTGTSTTNQKITVAGGKISARAALAGARDAKSIQNFLAQGSGVFLPIISYKTTPIWTILKRIYDEGSENYQRALNLEYVHMIKGFEVIDGNPFPNCATMNLKYTPDSATLEIVSNMAPGPFSCQKQCQISPRCTHWVLNYKKFTCRLLQEPPDSKFKTVELSPFSGIISGPETCEPLKENTPSCAKIGLKIEGPKVFGELRMPSATVCQDRCSDLGMCAYWSYYLVQPGDAGVKDYWGCQLYEFVSKHEKDPNSISGPKSCLYLHTEDGLSGNSIESQSRQARGAATSKWDLFEFQPRTNRADFALKHKSARCMTGQWKRLSKKSTSISKCAKLCDEAEECVYFGYGKGNQRGECFTGGSTCTSIHSEPLIAFDIYTLIAEKATQITIIATFAKCTESPLFISPERAQMAQDAKTCAAACKLDNPDSEFIYWDKDKEVADKNGYSQRCRCLEAKCTILAGNRCCALKKCDNTAAQKGLCRAQKKPEWVVYKMLETLANKVTLDCPSVDTFVTTTLPALDLLEVTSYEACLSLCRNKRACTFTMFHIKQKSCYLLGGGLLTLSQKKGWLAAGESCMHGLGKNPDTLFWNDLAFL